MSEQNNIFGHVCSLIAESNLSEAAEQLQQLASEVAEAEDIQLRAEYHYLLATVNFSTKPHTEVLAEALTAYDLVAAGAANQLIGRIQALIGKLHVALGDLKTGEEYIRDAISSFRRVDCKSELVLAYNKLGQVYFVRGDFRQAEAFLQEALSLMEQDPDGSEVSLMKARGNHARIKTLLGEWLEAEPVLVECVNFCRERQISISLVKNLLSLGYVKYLKGDLAPARELYQEAYTIITAEKLIRERSIYHEYMGDLQAALGDEKMARQHYGYALEIGERIAPESAIVSQTERRLAELEMTAANYAKAREHAQRARKVAALVGELVEVAAADKVLAALAARDNDHNGAARLFDESISSLQTCGCVREQAMALLAAGRALLAEPKWRRLAARYLQAAARLAEQLQMVALGAGCYFELSRLEVEADNFDEAVTHLRSCESEALRVGNDALIEKCRVLRLNIEERLIDSGLSSANQFALFSSVLDSKEYGNLKSGDLVESLKILQSKIKADRAFVLTLDPDSRAYELLAELSFEGNALGKIASSLGNGRGGSIPLDRPLFVSRLDGDRQQMFDYLGNSKVQIGTLITIPIQLTDETQGILYLDRLGDEAPPFSKSDLYFAIAFADIIAFKSAEEQKRKLSRDNRRLLSQLQEQLAFPNFITASPQIMEVLERVAQVKDSPISILIEGATGTGKDHLAKAIHYNSNRRDRRFISVNCAALPETLFESELFGHKRGAFTGAESDKIGLFEEANGGTFFLDEIGDMPLSVQVKLLRVIEEKEVVRLGETTPRQVDVRVLSATNRDLKEFMEVGKFRQDLYYRLSTFAFRLPPLRERREDIPLLIKHFMGKLAEEVVIEPEAFGCLCDYDWPGNVRELENELKKMVLLSGDTGVIGKNLVSRRLVEGWSGQLSDAAPADEFSLYDYLGRLERDYIVRALRQHKWVKKHAAQSLMIPESTLRLKLKQYSIAKN